MTEAQGDELNAWLLENLLGWSPPHSEAVKARVAEKGYSPPQFYLSLWLGPSGRLTGDLPDLSGSWEGAGLVLEAMRERGWEWALSRDTGWYIMRISEWGVQERADTGPMAVCLAAAEALKAEGERDD